MKLREFLSYRTHCLACGSGLNTSFHSQKKQKHSIVNDRWLVQIELNALSKGQKHYKVGYSIDHDTNDFCIEFFDQTGLQWFENESPMFLIDRFKGLDKNHGQYRIYKHCNICRKYNYTSNHFNLDYKKANLGELTVGSEYALLFKPIEDGYRGYKLYSYYDRDESKFEIFKISKEYWESTRRSDLDSKSEADLVKTKVIQFGNSPTEMMDKLNVLMTFS